MFRGARAGTLPDGPGLYIGYRAKQLGPAVKLSATPARLRRAAPTLGQHTAEVLAELGYDGTAIAKLAADGAVVVGGR